MKTTITLYTMSWNGYWDRYKDAWCNNINFLNTQPDEIIIVSDTEIDASLLKNNNVKNIIVPEYYEKRPASTYRNVAINNATSDWVIGADLDDEFAQCFLDNLPNDSDIHGFLFLDKASGNILYPDDKSLEDRLTGNHNPGKLIPSCSPIKRSMFNNIKYEHNCHEDAILYATASKLDINLSYDSSDQQPRYYYSGWHSQNEEIDRVTKIYREMISGLNRPVYSFWFSDSMSETRAWALEVLKASCNNLVLLNTEEFLKYSHPEMPIHKGFKCLTDNHKSDYARAYMMYFYGGGYSDVKPNEFDWEPYFDKLFLSRADAIGYAEVSKNDIAMIPNNHEEKDFLANNYHKFMGNGHYIFKPKTSIAFRWITEIHKKMDNSYDSLVNNPATIFARPTDPWYHETVKDYAFEWNEIGGRILHRLQYEDRLENILTGMPFTNNGRYR